MSASMRLAELLVSEAVHLMQQQIPAEQFLAELPSQLRSVRHVRIWVKDTAGVPVAVRPPAGPRRLARRRSRARSGMVRRADRLAR